MDKALIDLFFVVGIISPFVAELFTSQTDLSFLPSATSFQKKLKRFLPKFSEFHPFHVPLWF